MTTKVRTARARSSRLDKLSPDAVVLAPCFGKAVEPELLLIAFDALCTEDEVWAVRE